ncbi:MAG TPA: hypothetical protein VIW23_13945 [Candidatus Acidoferrum sp.]
MASQAASRGFSLQSSGDRVELRDHKLLLHASIFVVAFFLVFLRRPDALLNAQFYAEDGTYFYANAYNLGWHSLLLPYGGYLSTLLRLVGFFAQLFPLSLAPLVMNVCAIAIQILPIHIFLSSRFSSIPFNTRLIGALLYLAIPNSFEIHANTTNIQWHLALAGCLIVLGRPDSRLIWRAIDFAVLALLILDGLMSSFLIPIVLILWYVRDNPHYKSYLMALIPGAFLQFAILLLSNSRRPAPNGASLLRLIDIVGGQLFFSSVLGLATSIQLFFRHNAVEIFLAALVSFVIGMCFTAYALRHGPLQLKLFYMFAIMVITSALIRPISSFDGMQNQWELLQIPGCGNRYYFFPMIAFLATPIWILTTYASRPKLVRCAALIVVLLLPIGIIRDWHYKPFEDFHFQEYVAQFNRAAPGTHLVIPINPDWKMELTKR